MPYIYAIIREKESKQLKLIQEYYSCPSNISNEVLARHYNYAYNLYEAYCSELPRISVKVIARTRGHRLDALALQNAQEQIKNKYDIVAISHRRGGWTHFDWNFGESVTFHIFSNFGFGSQSELTSTFKYQNIILAPYSYYVKYRNSTYATVTKCTYSYQLDYSEWKTVMKDCLDFYNAVVDGDVKFIINWLNDQLSYMISELERFVNIDSCFLYDATHNNHVSRGTTVTGDDFWIIKAQKIAYSLEFVENIKVLPVQIDSTGYIGRLYSLCESFSNKLLEKIEVTENLLKAQTEVLNELTTRDDYPVYIKLYNKYYFKKEWHWSSNKFKMIWFLMHLLNKVSPEYDLKEIKTHFPPLEKIINQISEQRQRVNTTKWLIETLKKDQDVMNNYLEKYTP